MSLPYIGFRPSDFEQDEPEIILAFFSEEFLMTPPSPKRLIGDFQNTSFKSAVLNNITAIGGNLSGAYIDCRFATKVSFLQDTIYKL